MVKWICIWILAISIFGCDANDDPNGRSNDSRVHSFQIVISGSITPSPVEFAGSYTCDDKNGLDLTKDITGSGSMSVGFECIELKRVRVQKILGAGLISLTIYKNGEVLFESAPTGSTEALLYVK